MANFDGATAKHQSVRDANNTLELVRATYIAGSLVRAAVARYQSGADPVFNAALAALYTASELAELATIAAAISTMVSNLESNHPGAIGGN